MGLDMAIMKRTYEEDYVKYEEQEAIYWRKENHIHNWFVNNIQNGEDDCGKYQVTREQLRELIDLCKRTYIENRIDLLPTKGGFFFGSTDYDEYYFESCKEAVINLESMLVKDQFNEDKIAYYYYSSW